MGEQDAARLRRRPGVVIDSGMSTMPSRKFGWTLEQVPLIGQGTWNIEGRPAEERRSIEALRLGIDLGMTHIDTAEMYGSGRAEELVGEARLKADRAASRLLVQSAWWEHGRPADAAPRLADELRLAAAWQGLESVSVSRWGDATDDLAGVMPEAPRHDAGPSGPPPLSAEEPGADARDLDVQELAR